MRAFLRIANRAGDVPSFPMRLDQDQSIRVDVTPAEYPAPPTVRPRKRVFDIPKPDGSVRRIISPGRRHEAEAIRRKLVERQGAETTEVGETTTNYPAATFSSLGDVLYSSFVPGAIKIAYELSHYWLGDLYLDDPGAVALRVWLTELLDGEKGRGWKTPEELKFIQLFYRKDIFPRILARRPEHVAFMTVAPDRGEVAVAYRIFNVLGVVVIVGRDPVRYSSLPWKDVLLMDPVSRSFNRCTRDDVDKNVSPSNVVFQGHGTLAIQEHSPPGSPSCDQKFVG